MDKIAKINKMLESIFQHFDSNKHYNNQKNT